MAYSLEPLSDGCYPGTAVLVNKLNIQDGQKLAQVEADITKLRIAQWEIQPLMDTFDFEHYKAIHQHLFGDLYDWAGQVRTVNLADRKSNV